MNQLKNPSGLIIFSLFIGWLADFLFHDQPLGISLIIFVVIFLGGLWVLTNLEDQRLQKRNLWLAVPLLFCATMVMVRANELLTMLNVLISGFTLILLGMFSTTGQVAGLGLIGFTTLPFRALGCMAIRPVRVVNDHVDIEVVRVAGRDKFYPVIRGAVLATPLLFILVGLLASADAIFAQSVLRMFDIRISAAIFEFLWSGLVIFGMSWIALGYLAYSLRSSVSVPRPLPERMLGKVRGRWPLGTIESRTILVLINLLFGLFVSIQFAYLFGGQSFLSLDGISYAEYARRGFFELVMVVCITLFIVQCMNWFAVKKYKTDRIVFNALVSLAIGFVIVMLISAFQRLALYEWTFGFTQLRVVVHTFMIWMGLVLVWYVITLWLRPDRFAVGALVCLFGFVISLNILNPDAFIVRKNLQRYQAVGHLDLEYLTQLSADAVPHLTEVAAEIENDIGITSGNRCDAGVWLSDLSSSGRMADKCIEANDPDLLDDYLDYLNLIYYQQSAQTGWQSFHIGHHRAMQTLQAVSATP